MFKSFSAKNFRCFRDLTIERFERINLIAGKNNVGKTALLEGLFLHIGSNNPSLPHTIDMIRGISTLTVDAEELWGWLFFGKNIDDVIELTSLNEAGENRCLQIRLVEPKVSGLIQKGNGDTESPESVGSIATSVNLRELILEFQDAESQKVTSRAVITPKGIKLERASLFPVPKGVFIGARAGSAPEDPQRFSKLDEIGHQDDVVIPLRHIEPRLLRLALHVTGGVPVIKGDIGIGRLISLPYMGEGMGRLLSILLAIADVENGFFMVDEIETGLHYSVMVKVWRAIADAARRHNVQIFATTHSWECIKAAHEAFSASEKYDFCLHRLERIDNEILAVTYDQETLATSIEMSLEVR